MNPEGPGPAQPTPSPTPTPTPTAFGATGATGESTWERWASSLEQLQVDASRVTVVAPHPDDETFGCGGLIAELRARSAAVTVVTVSDGAASHPGQVGLAALRRSEQHRATRALGCSRAPVWLGLPDGGLAEWEQALRERLVPLIAGSDLLVGPWPGDRHPDHEVVGRVAEQEASALGVAAISYPVWLWRWGGPDDVAGVRCRRLPLSDLAIEAKRTAMSCFPSQTTSAFGDVIIDEEMLTCFSRRSEVFLDA